MTPEIKAAMERLRQVRGKELEDYWGIYGINAIHEWSTVIARVEGDRYALSEAFLADHPADDDEPATLDWIESVVPEDGRMTIATCGDAGRVYLCEDDVANGIEIKTRRQLRSLLKGLGHDA